MIHKQSFFGRCRDRAIAVIATLLCSVSFAVSQDCNSILGYTDFKPTPANSSDTTTFYSVAGVVTTYPSGYMLSPGTATNEIEELPMFSDGESVVYAVTSNPSKLNGEGTGQFADIDVPMYVVQCAAEPMTSIFDFSVYCAKPGTEYKVTVDLYNIMDPDSSIAKKWPSYETTPYDFVVGKPQPYGKDMESVKIKNTEQKKTVEFIGTVGAGETSITFSIFTGYNCQKNIALGIGSIKIEGCLNPRIKSGQGLKVCKGEQTSLTLDRDYAAKSYKWEKSTNGGTSWTTVSTNKTALEEINETALYRCIVDGAESNVLEIVPETCCEVNGKPASRKTVFLEDFGYFKNARTYVDREGNESKLPAKYVDFRTNTNFSIPENKFDGEGQVNDGYYAVVVPTEQGYALAGQGQYATWMNGIVTDHSSIVDGRDNSACLFINVTENYKGPIFENTISGICKQKQLYFECSIANMSGADMSPLVTIQICKTDGTLIAEEKNVEASKGAGWVSVKLSDIFTDETEVIMRVIADCGTNCSNGSFWSKGNDLAIDDIKFMTCSPPSVSAFFDLTTQSLDTTVCKDANLSITMPVSELLDNYFDRNQMYVLQCSDDLKKWKHVIKSSLSTIDFNSDDLTDLYPDAEVIYARVIVASPSAAIEFEKDPNMANTDDDCNDYSISDPFTITIDCPKCTESAKPDIESTAEITKKSGKKYVYLCEGESTTLSVNDLTGTTEAGDPYTNYAITWTADKKKIDEATGVKAPEVEVSYDDVTEIGVTYKISVIDAAFNDCETTDEITIIANPKVKDSLEVPMPFCEGEASVTTTIAGFDLEWYDEEDSPLSTVTNAFLNNLAGNDKKPYVFKYVVVDSKTGCKSDPHTYTVDVKEQPSAPNDTVIQLVVTGSVLALEEFDNVPAGITQMWYKDKNGVGSPSYPEIDRTNKGSFTYYRSYKTKAGCESELAEVIIEIKSAAPPKIENAEICEGSDIDYSTLVTPDDKFEIHWYKDEDKTGGEISAPSLTSATPGAYKYYVTQQGTEEPKPESDPVPVTVTVYGVDKPKTEDVKYCAGDEAAPLEATPVSDGKFMQANGFVWYSGTTKFSEAPVPTTDITGDGVQTIVYEVGQTYTIKSSNEVCYGDTVPLKVIVTKVAQPTGTKSVSYVKKDGEANKKFTKNLLEQDSKVINTDDHPGMTLVWSMSKEGPYTETIPTPVYNEANTETMVRVSYYCKWIDDATSCESESVEVVVTISSSPVPDYTPLEFCFDHKFTGEELKNNAKVNTNGGKLENADEYEVYWFAPDKKASAEGAASDPALLADAIMHTADPSLAPDIESYWPASISGTEEVFYFYLVQSNAANTTGIATTSSVSMLPITLYANPELAIGKDGVAPVCETSVNLTSKDCWSVTNGVTLNATAYVLGDEDKTDVAKQITESGTYKVSGSFIIPSTKEECKSNEIELAVDIQSLNFTVDMPDETCPGSDITAEINIDYKFYDKYDANHNIYISVFDKSVGDKSVDNPDKFVASYKSGSFKGEAGDKFTIDFSIDAGVCSKTFSSEIKLGDGPLIGTVTYKESGNTELENGRTVPVSKKLSVYTCGEELEIDLSTLTKTEELIEWFDNSSYSGTPVKTGAKVSFTENDNKTYYVRYTNNCYAYFQIDIYNVAVSITSAPDGAKEFCEGETYVKTIDFTCSETPSVRQWYRNGEKYANLTPSLNFQTLKKESHEGKFKYLVSNRGCSDSIDVVDLTVKKYVDFDADGYEMIKGKKTYIVIAEEDANIDLKYNVPADGSGVTAQWKDNGTAASGNAAGYTISSVNEDHNIEVEVSGSDFCPHTEKYVVLRDAKLKLSMDIDDVMCLRDEKILSIDTTGTGKFVRGNPTLTVIATPETGTATQVKGFTTNASGVMEKKVSPVISMSYKVTFDYGTQHEEVEKEITVFNFQVTTKKNLKVCAGDELELSAVATPASAKLKWYETDKATELGETVAMVSPEFDGLPEQTSIVHKYYVMAYNDQVECHNFFAQDVTVFRPLEGELKDTSVCNGKPVKMDAGSYNASKYEWTSSSSAETSVGRYKNDIPASTTTYTVSMSRGECKATAEATATVTTNPVIASIDSLGYRDVNIVMDGAYGAAPYTFKVDNSEFTTDSYIKGLGYGNHSLVIIDANGCESRDTFRVNPPDITIPNFFTPDGDSENEVWVVPGLAETYPDADIKIFDRFGKLLIKQKGDADGWDGTYNGTPMPSTDYWYEITVHEIDTIYTGSFTLIRR